ncbi:MAG: choice-of-anchor Q domain-containing protein [Thermoanaerobaculia bacterium]
MNQHLTVAGTPTFTSVDPVIGNPLVDVDNRLQVGSAAIDTGVDVGILDDIDGDIRPLGAGFDIGADEYGGIFADGFESGDTSEWSSTVP